MGILTSRVFKESDFNEHFGGYFEKHFEKHFERHFGEILWRLQLFHICEEHSWGILGSFLRALLAGSEAAAAAAEKSCPFNSASHLFPYIQVEHSGRTEETLRCFWRELKELFYHLSYGILC